MTTKKQSRLRIIAGMWRSRLIVFSPTTDLRPTSNRIRETLFNWLQDYVPGEDCLDLFAGSGACGIEALSRGARSAVFVENNRQAANMIRTNLSTLGAGSIKVHCTDVFEWLGTRGQPDEPKFGLVFIDPPYSADLELETCRQLEASNKLKASAFVYLESNKLLSAESFPKTWSVKKVRKAGSVNYYLMRRADPEREPGHDQQ